MVHHLDPSISVLSTARRVSRRSLSCCLTSSQCTGSATRSSRRWSKLILNSTPCLMEKWLKHNNNNTGCFKKTSHSWLPVLKRHQRQLFCNLCICTKTCNSHIFVVTVINLHLLQIKDQKFLQNRTLWSPCLWALISHCWWQTLGSLLSPATQYQYHLHHHYDQYHLVLCLMVDSLLIILPGLRDNARNLVLVFLNLTSWLVWLVMISTSGSAELKSEYDEAHKLVLWSSEDRF